jgi:hypothetical protein
MHAWAGLHVSFAIGRGCINLNHWSGLSAGFEKPMAFYHDAIAVSRGVHELPFPSASPNQFGFDLFQRFREFCLQKIVANSAYGFFFPPTIEPLSALVPKVNHAVQGAGHDAIVCELKIIMLLE